MLLSLELFLAGGLVAALVGVLARRQGELVDRRRTCRLLWLELIRQQEILAICQKASYAVRLPVTDWSWLRYRLAEFADPPLLSLLTSYYSTVETGWNQGTGEGGQPLELQQRKTLEGVQQLLERALRQLECERDRYREVRLGWIPWLRKLPRDRQPVPQQQEVLEEG